MIRRALPYLTVVLVIAIGYDAWIFYNRWSVARDAEKADALKEAQDAQHTLDVLGGDRLKILSFYANPPAIRRGGHSSLCYGVNEAEHVRIDPPVEQLSPSLSRCFAVSPSHDTDYKLTAEDRVGHAVTQSLTVKVAP